MPLPSIPSPNSTEPFVKPDKDFQPLQNPLTIICIACYGYFIVRFSRASAKLYFQQVWTNINRASATWFYLFHTDCVVMSVASFVSLSITCLLSNTSIIDSLGAVHIVFLTSALISWTFALTVRDYLKPIKRSVSDIPYPNNVLYGLITFIWLVIMTSEAYVWITNGDPQHPMIGEVFFLVSLLTVLCSGCYQLDWLIAQQMLVWKEGDVACVLVRHGNHYVFEEYDPSSLEQTTHEGSVYSIETGEVIFNFSEFISST